MKYCRFLLNNRIRYGTVEDLGGDLWISGPAPAPAEDLVYRLALEQAEIADFDFEPMPLNSAELLPPVTPSKIVCVGRNYREHVLELGNEMPTEPLLFFKPPSSLLEPGGVVRLPALSTRVDFEGELALVIGRSVRNLKPETDWRHVVRGFTLANDISARDLQKKDGQWARAKGFDTFCPVGPIVSDELDLDAGVRIETRVNGEVRQRASTHEFIFAVTELLCAITAAFTLETGDLILTGTPSGVGPLKAGDRVEVSVAGLGTLTNFVEAG
ncbi:MAG: fumarylacetoacetate hydrolase family protein [Terracidiphilus sp.]|jgi:2-keto-4-pentenoate hydratase/2-oxohepta-3-ene-1,7-dioic acid hydratase in catechol pathway